MRCPDRPSSSALEVLAANNVETNLFQRDDGFHTNASHLASHPCITKIERAPSPTALLSHLSHNPSGQTGALK